MPRIRLSRAVWLVVISQVLSLAVVSSALWGFQKDLSLITGGVEQATAETPSDGPIEIAGTESSAGDSGYQYTELEQPRFLGKSSLLSECMTYAFWASRHRSVSGIDMEEQGDCDSLDSILDSITDGGQEDGQPTPGSGVE